ncbi:Twinfilin-1 [Tieghemiomyces parasiticus]|uniref:Twinfilin-1 n=1 Tax=Tieghemiomyces parasiticus TaxID=78921 RepID=A0A9W8DSR4_9FUNG|nr:Twinfilin-1 [Tieghemiomyces parasiticus]
MSHQSGIEVTPELTERFATCVSPDCTVRFILVRIVDNALHAAEVVASHTDQDADFSLLSDQLVSCDPSYILYRLDDEGGDRWLFISYIPDHGKVRDKMVYAATQSTLLKQLGSNRFVHVVAVRDPKDIQFSTLQAFLDCHDVRLEGTLGADTPPDEGALPLSEREREQRRIQAEQATDPSATVAPSMAGRAHVVGAKLPLSPAAEAAIRSLLPLDAPSPNTVVLRLDTTTETLHLDDDLCGGEKAASFDSASILGDQLPDTDPRFVVYKFRPASNSEDTPTSVYPVFVYVCPINSSVRTRMMYSTFRRALVDAIINTYEVPLAKRLEIDDPRDLTDTYLEVELAPQIAAAATSKSGHGDGGTPLVSLAPVSANPPLPALGTKFKRPVAPGRQRTAPRSAEK